MLTDERILEIGHKFHYSSPWSIDFARAIEAEVRAEAQELVAWMLDAPNWIIRLERFVGESQKCDGLWIPLYTAPQPPALCPKCAELEAQITVAKNSLLWIKENAYKASRDVLSGYANDCCGSLSHYANDLQSKVAEQTALIEQCEKALNECSPQNIEANYLKREALSAIAAQKGGA